MISCTEFIPLYSELFKYLEEKKGREEVIKYWEHISDNYIDNRLGNAVKNYGGIYGCYEYWSKSLNEEACDFTMTLDKDNGTFAIDMHKCPSRGMLNSLQYMNPYYDYCGHCKLIYSRVLKKHGIEVLKEDYSEVNKAKCYLSFIEKKK